MARKISGKSLGMRILLQTPKSVTSLLDPITDSALRPRSLHIIRTSELFNVSGALQEINGA